MTKSWFSWHVGISYVAHHIFMRDIAMGKQIQDRGISLDLPTSLKEETWINMLVPSNLIAYGEYT